MVTILWAVVDIEKCFAKFCNKFSSIYLQNIIYKKLYVNLCYVIQNAQYQFLKVV